MMDWMKAKNILCVRLDNMGDVIMMSPAIRAIKDSNPEVKLTLLTSLRGMPIVPFIKEVDSSIQFDAPWINESADYNSELFIEQARLLHSRMFDAAIIFTSYSQSVFPAAMLCWLAKIPLRLGYSHENPNQLLTDWIPDPEPQKFISHEVQRQLDLVERVGFTTSEKHIRLHINKEIYDTMQEALEKKNINISKPWVIIHPGASTNERMYPTEQFSEVITMLLKNKIQVVVTGRQSEKPLLTYMQKQNSNAVFFDALNLEQFITLISMCPLLITNNTGPAHIAAGVNTPIIDIYARTNPQHTPWMVKSKVLYFDVPCKACARGVCPQDHSSVQKSVEPADIFLEVKKILNISDERSDFTYSYI